MSKISQYANTPSPSSAFEIIGTDPNNTSMSASGTTETVTLAQLANAVPTLLPEPLTSGEALVSRAAAATSNTLTSGDVLFSYWTALKTETCNHIATCTGGTATGTATYCNIGVYSVAAGTGNLTLLASTGDLHASMWTSTFTEYSVSLTGSFSKVAGTRYAVGALCVAGTPCSLVCAGSAGFYFSRAPVLMGVLTGQATLPASVTAASLAGGPPFGAVLQAVVYP